MVSLLRNNEKKSFFIQVDLVKYTTIPITESLLKLDPTLNRVSVECFECIMRYMGDLPTTPELNEVKCVYTILMVGDGE